MKEINIARAVCNTSNFLQLEANISLAKNSFMQMNMHVLKFMPYNICVTVAIQ